MDEVRESIPERPPYNKMVDEVLQVLSHSDQAAYMVYLKLCNRFGAGQKI